MKKLALAVVFLGLAACTGEVADDTESEERAPAPVAPVLLEKLDNPAYEVANKVLDNPAY